MDYNRSALGCLIDIPSRKPAVLDELQTWQLRVLAATSKQSAVKMDRSNLVEASYEPPGTSVCKQWVVEDIMVYSRVLMPKLVAAKLRIPAS